MVKKWFYTFPIILVFVGVTIISGFSGVFSGKSSPEGKESVQTQKKILWVKVGEATASAAEWSKNYSTPSGLFKIMPVDGKVEVLFSNGSYYLLDSLEQIDMGRVSGEYRLRGVGKDVMAGIFTAKTM